MEIEYTIDIPMSDEIEALKETQSETEFISHFTWLIDREYYVKRSDIIICLYQLGINIMLMNFTNLMF